VTFAAEDIAQRFRAFDCRSKGPRFDSGCPLCPSASFAIINPDKLVFPIAITTIQAGRHAYQCIHASDHYFASLQVSKSVKILDKSDSGQQQVASENSWFHVRVDCLT
jgi:hypothetical protein